MRWCTSRATSRRTNRSTRAERRTAFPYDVRGTEALGLQRWVGVLLADAAQVHIGGLAESTTEQTETGVKGSGVQCQACETETETEGPKRGWMASAR